MVLVRPETDWVVSVPPEGPVSPCVGSVVHMVWACRSSRGTVGTAARCLRVPPHLLLLHLSGLSHQARHSVHGQGLTHQRGEVHVLDREDDIAGGGGNGGHHHGQREKQLKILHLKPHNTPYNTLSMRPDGYVISLSVCVLGKTRLLQYIISLMINVS